MHLTIKIEHREDGRFLATVPELPGCQFEGDTAPCAIYRVKGVALRALAERIEDYGIELDGVVFHLEVTRKDVESCPTADGVLDALAKMEHRYADFGEFRAEAFRFGRRFRACQVGEDAIGVEEYLDGLYLLARFSRYSRAPSAGPEAWMLTQQKGGRPLVH